MLQPGQRLARFELIALLGRGGMGEVWRARDLRLGRDVALKVLPRQLAAEPERVARFEREARALAALNHANVAQIFELGESGGEETLPLSGPQPAPLHFLVMELVEGETLAEKVKRGPLPLAEGMALAVQVAEGLRAAHGRGVVHRDLKPANIIITPEGQAKILDFGLARFRPSQRPAEVDITQKLSDPGMVVGTAAYMAPEQVRGEECDERCDVWAFGCCWAEILTGARAFAGATVPEIIGKVLAGDADLSKLPGQTPRAIRTMLERCFSLDRKDRPSLAEVVRELRALGQPGKAWVGRRWFWPAAVLLLVAALGAAFVAVRLRSAGQQAAPAAGLRLAVALEPVTAAPATAVPLEVATVLDGEVLRTVSACKDLLVTDGPAASVRVRGTVAREPRGLRARLTVNDARSGALVGVVDLPLAPLAGGHSAENAAEALASLLELEQVCRELERDDPMHGFLVRRTHSVEAARSFRDGIHLLERTRNAQAKAALQQALVADPGFWPAHLYLALNAKATSHFDEAEREVVQAQRLAVRPDAAEAAIIEETAATVAEDSQRRLEALERARKLFPGSGELTYRTAQAYRIQDRPAEAIPLLEELIARGWRPDWSPTREELAFCQLLAGRLTQVLTTTAAGEERFPTRYRYPLLSALSLQQLGRTEEAREALRRALRKHLDFTSTPPLAVHQLGAYWASLLRWDDERRREYKAVLAEVERQLRGKAGSAELLQARGEALVGLGRFAEARNVLEPLSQASDADPGVFLALARAEVGLHDPDAARRALASAAAGWRQGNVPALGTLAYNIAAGWAALGDTQRGFEWLLRARDQYGVDRLDLAMDPDLDPLRRAGMLAQLPPRH
jgi:tetratricopeptide (TPR) repeat protein